MVYGSGSLDRTVAAPGPVLWVRDQVAGYWVLVDVVGLFAGLVWIAEVEVVIAGSSARAGVMGERFGVGWFDRGWEHASSWRRRVAALGPGRFRCLLSPGRRGQVDVFGHDDPGFEVEAIAVAGFEQDGLEEVSKDWGAQERLSTEAAYHDEVEATCSVEALQACEHRHRMRGCHAGAMTPLGAPFFRVVFPERVGLGRLRIFR